MIDLTQPQKIIVKTLAGCEGLLEEELTSIGCTNVQILTRAVMLDGTWEDIYKINYTSRFALNVLVNISNFSVHNYDDIYNGAKRVFWYQLMDVKNTFAIRHAINSPAFAHTQLCALRVKDALVDSFTEKYNERPSVDKDNPDFVFHVHISGSKCQLLIDTSGPSLYKRGYRQYQGFAPLNEILAAALVKWSGWEPSSPLLDPFCGSGTILTEAYMQAVNRPAGFYRRYFAFTKFKGFDPRRWEAVKQHYNALETKPESLNITGYDINGRVAGSALKNLANIGAENDIAITKADFFNAHEQVDGLYIITNPPYGKRIEVMDESFFKTLSSFLKHHCAGSRVTMVAPKELVARIGFRPAFKQAVFNGEIDCFAIGFDLFKGSKKEKSPAGE